MVSRETGMLRTVITKIPAVTVSSFYQRAECLDESQFVSTFALTCTNEALMLSPLFLHLLNLEYVYLIPRYILLCLTPQGWRWALVILGENTKHPTALTTRRPSIWPWYSC